MLETGATPATKTYPELTFGGLFTSTKTFDDDVYNHYGVFFQCLKSSNTKTFMKLYHVTLF